MFTGIIQEIGEIKLIQKKGNGLSIQVFAPRTSKSLEKGGSVNINGACQTAEKIEGDTFEVFAMAETVKRTGFKDFRTGTKVNLELPLTLNDPLGGHLVAGHVDTTGRITSIEPGSQSIIIKISFDPEYAKYLIEKGSVAVDGISLTIYGILSGEFSVSLIPETRDYTNLSIRKVGDLVNLEFDQIGKYIENFTTANKGGLTLNDLSEHGYMR